MMEILLHTHPCYPIDASVSRGYAGIFYAHTCSVPARRPCRNIATPTWKGRVSPQPNCTHNRAQWNVWPAPSIYLSTGCFNFGERYRRRSQNDALDALTVGIVRKKVNWVLVIQLNFSDPGPWT